MCGARLLSEAAEHTRAVRAIADVAPALSANAVARRPALAACVGTRRAGCTPSDRQRRLGGRCVGDGRRGGDGRRSGGGRRGDDGRRGGGRRRGGDVAVHDVRRRRESTRGDRRDDRARRHARVRASYLFLRQRRIERQLAEASGRIFDAIARLPVRVPVEPLAPAVFLRLRREAPLVERVAMLEVNIALVDCLETGAARDPAHGEQNPEP